MPWSKAKEKIRKILADPAEQARLTDLFNQCFRIQKEVSAAARHYVPMIIENVCGAQRWVGKAKWNFGSFYLWGDVPALMPIAGKHVKCAPNNLRAAVRSEWLTQPRSEGHKSAGVNWSDQTKRGQDFTRVAGAQSKGRKNFTKLAGTNSSKSKKRKQASAEIAKIPPRLAEWIARVFKPEIKNAACD